jgi:flagellar FliJ protein
MKFEFVYENLLKHKKTLEEVAQRAFAEAQAHLEEMKRELNRLYEQVDDSRKRASELEKIGGEQAASISVVNEFIVGQKIRIEMQREKMRFALQAAEAKQEELIMAVREFKTLEKLKEKKWKEFKAFLKKQELKFVDDLVTTRFKRRDHL